MMVGSIMSGKTEIIHTLASALSQINKQAAIDNQNNELDQSMSSNASEMQQNKKASVQYEQVKVNTMNPKSVTIG